MKKLVLFITCLLIATSTLWAYDFSAKCSTGQTLYYLYNDGSSVSVVVQNSFPPFYTTLPGGNLTIPSSVTYNGKTYSVTSIGGFAFYSCTSLSSVTIPNSVTSIATNIFLGCTGLTAINVDEGNTAYKSIDGVLYNKDATTLICFPAGKTGSFTIPNSVTSIGSYAFRDCSGLTSVTIPNSVTSIGNYAFYGCSGLTSITIGNGVTSIGNYAFYGCSGLTSITIPNSVTSIGEDAFYNTGWWKNQSDGIIYKNGWCLGYKGNKSTGTLTILEGTKGIAGSAFYQCEGLTSITIPNSVTSIGGYAFERTGWWNNQPNGIIYKDGWCLGYKGDEPTGTLTIREGTKGIADYAFCGCSGLTKITCEAATPPTIDEYTFYYPGGGNNNPEFSAYDVPLHVPSNSIQAYKDHTIWGNFTTILPLPTYTITATAANETMGGVSGSDTYDEHATATLTATPNTGYHFVQWNDGNTQNPRSITVIQDATYTATFAINTYNVAANCNDNNMGAVIGAGTYNYNTTATLSAIPANGYSFVQWNDGNTQNPRSFTVTANASYTANFAINTYTITVNSNNENMGSVTGSGAYNYNTKVAISATPYSGYQFLQWNDGNTQNPRTITVADNTTYTAIFALKTYTITASSNNTNMGMVTGGGTYNLGAEVTLVATPNNGYKFVQWSDGSTQNPRTVTVTNNMSYTATFAIGTYTITVSSNNTNMGTVNGSGSYNYNSNIVLTATPYSGYEFVCWNDGNTQNPRTVTVTGDANYMATFSIKTYSITANSNNENMGTVTGSGNYTLGSEATLTATPKSGFKFVCWEDGNTDNPRSVTVTSNMNLVAIFIEGTNAIAETNSNNAQIFGGEKRIIINNAANATVAIYDVMGRTVVKEQRINSNNEIFAVPQTGIYIVRMGKAAKKVFVK